MKPKKFLKKVGKNRLFIFLKKNYLRFFDFLA